MLGFIDVEMTENLKVMENLTAGSKAVMTVGSMADSTVVMRVQTMAAMTVERSL